MGATANQIVPRTHVATYGDETHDRWIPLFSRDVGLTAGAYRHPEVRDRRANNDTATSATMNAPSNQGLV